MYQTQTHSNWQTFYNKGMALIADLSQNMIRNIFGFLNHYNLYWTKRQLLRILGTICNEFGSSYSETYIKANKNLSLIMLRKVNQSPSWYLYLIGTNKRKKISSSTTLIVTIKLHNIYFTNWMVLTRIQQESLIL